MFKNFPFNINNSLLCDWSLESKYNTEIPF